LSKTKGISEDLLINGYDVRINTRGSSMFPLIRTGDRIIVSPEKNPGIGDIIVFKRNDEMVCHRLVRVFEKDNIIYFQTRGDSFFGLDEPVTVDQILGKVIRVEREDVYFVRRILLLFYPALRFGKLNAFVISALIRIKKYLPSTKRY